MASELSHYESPRMSLSHTEPVPPRAGELHLSIFRLDNIFFHSLMFGEIVSSRLSPFVPIGPLVCDRTQTPLALMSWGVAVVHPCRLST